MGLLPIAANAYDAQIDGIYYTFNGDEAEVTCLDLDRSYNVNAYSGAIVVPESVNYDGKDYRVTSIGEGAFDNCKNLTSVILPKGVESIGNYSFGGCKSLTAVALPEGVKSIGTGAFSGCTSLESVTLPSSLTSIGEIAFRRCTCLISITIPDGVKDISYGTFASCSNMTDIIFSEGVTSIGEGAFQGCSKLTSISIPNSATYIGEYAFWNCSSLLSIIFGKNMTKIDEYAFKNDHLLTDIYCLAEEVPEATNAFSAWSYRPMESTTLHVPASSIDSYKTTEPWNCFGNIVALPAVANEYIDPQTNVVYTYEPGQGTASVKAGYEEAQSTGFGEGEVFFYSGSPDAEGDIVILDRFSVGTEEYVVTRIGEGAFRENSKIKSVSIPETVTDIGKLAFCWCDSLTSVQLPSGLTKIAPWLFCCCNQLMSVTIPSSVSTIGERAFADCGSLANITLPESLTSIGYGVFSNCYFVEDSFINKSTLTSSNKWGATLCDMETSEGLMLKDNGVVFCRPWTWINSVTIPNGVTSIEKKAFMDRSGLTSVTIPYSVTSIGEDAFLRCFGLSSVTIPSSVTKIGNSAFCLCYGLTSVTIGSGMASIGAGAFYECRNLRNVCCYAEDVPDTGINTFEGLPIASATLHVPAGSVEKYKATAPWNEFGNIVEDLHQPLPFLEDNPIWVYKYERLAHWYSGRFIDKGNRSFAYYFLGGKKEIEGKVYTMMGEIINYGDNKLAVSRWLPVREENGVVYAFTDSLPGLIEHDYLEVPYLQVGRECVLYNFCSEIGETLFPQKNYTAVMSYDTYQLMDGTACRVLKTKNEDFCLYEKLGYLNGGAAYGVMDPPFEIIDQTGGDVFEERLNAYFGNDMMLYKAPDAQEGLCVNDTCSTRDDAEAYVRSYKPDPRQEEVFAFIRRLQKASEVEPVTFTAGQMATIILPTEPDAGKGKYYRLDRVEAEQIVFEQELQPRAHVPYIIVPFEDFSIDPGQLELEGLKPDTVSVDGISFIGTFRRDEIDSKDGLHVEIIDATSDCSPLPAEGQGERLAFVGTLRAYLTWHDPYNPGGSKGPEEEMKIVLHDHGTGSLSPGPSPEGEGRKDAAIYDLSGKMVNGKWLNGKSPKGIYIKDRKKWVLQH